MTCANRWRSLSRTRPWRGGLPGAALPGAAIAAYLGTSDTFDRAIATLASACADQNERDYDALKAAVASGRITAEEGV